MKSYRDGSHKHPVRGLPGMMLGREHKKLGVNLFRFVFSGTKKSDLSEKRFFVELELLNPHVSPNVPVFGYAPKTNVNPEDLQEILLGKTSQKTYSGEDIETPSYCAIRFGVLGTKSKLLCAYFPFNKLYFFQHPFKIEVGKFSFLGRGGRGPGL